MTTTPTPKRTRAKKPPILSPAEAATLIPSGSRIALSGFSSVGVAQAIMGAMVSRFERESAPGNLTIYHAAGHASGIGCDSMAAAGMISKVIGGHWGLMHEFRRKMMENEIEAHNWPQGMVVRAFREMARGSKWGFQSSIGLGTYIDPRNNGGCMNTRAQETGSLIKVETAPDGSETLRYSSFPIDISFVRGWSADAHGNVRLGLEALSLSPLDIALAARAQGGAVFCQIRHHEPEKTYRADEIAIPAYLIDYLVLSDTPSLTHRQCNTHDEIPALVGGNLHRHDDASTPLPPVPAGPRGWIGRRAAEEIGNGEVFNLGIGIPGDTVTAALAEAGRLEKTIPTLESGVIGGVGLGGHDFGVALNPEARIDQAAMFDFYHGGGLDITVMGAAEIDELGNINVSLFNGRPTGCGGFIDITQSARRIVFCSTLTAGSLEIALEKGKLRIEQEGKHRKFVKRVQQVTFSAAQAMADGRDVLLVTERCVFALAATPEGGQGWVLTEIAPGIDLQRDILAQMDFCPSISPQLKEMNPALFRS